MRLNPAEAALCGTALGATATFASTWLTQRATTRRERGHRLWDRRMAVYDEAVTVISRSARDREEVLRTGRPPTRRDPQAVETDSTSVQARLEIYGSDRLLDALKESLAAMSKWIHAWGEWESQEETNPRRSDRDPLWVKLVASADRSVIADRRFLELVRTEARSQPEKRIRGFRRLPRR